MPYFERKPFSDLQDSLAGRLPSSAPERRSAEDFPLVDQAAAILRKESQSAPRWAPPANQSNLPWLGTSLVPVTLKAPAAASPGQKALISISIVNDSSDDVSYSFSFTDLISLAGERIPSGAVRAIPDAAVVPSAGTLDASFEILIPCVPAGQYFGLAICREALPAILTVTVSA